MSRYLVSMIDTNPGKHISASCLYQVNSSHACFQKFHFVLGGKLLKVRCRLCFLGPSGKYEEL